MTVPSAATIFRDFNTDGVPLSGAYNPKKSEIREWAALLEGVSGAVYDSLAEFTAASIGASVESVTLTAILTTEPAQRSYWRRMDVPGSASDRGNVQSSDGAWWQINNGMLYASQFRRTADGVNWAPAIQAMHDYANANAPGWALALDPGPKRKIAPTTWSDRIFTITNNFTLLGMGEGSKLVWDSDTDDTCDIFRVATTIDATAKIIFNNVRVEPDGWVEAFPTTVWAAKGAGTIYGRDVIRMDPVAGSVHNWIRELRLIDCYFGPTNGHSIDSTELIVAPSAPDRFRGFFLQRNKLWGGIHGVIGDSCTARDNEMVGFQTAFDVWQGAGSSVFACDHNNCFTGNGALRWRGGPRLRFTNNNCEQYGPRTNALGEGTPINGVIDIDNSGFNSISPHVSVEGNYFALVTTGSLFTRVGHIGDGGAGPGFYGASIKNNTFGAVTGALASGTTALKIDSDCLYTDQRGNSFVNNTNGSILTVDDSGEGTAGIPRAITFSNGWAAHASYPNTNRVLRDNGMVVFTIAIKDGSTAPATVVGNIPVGWRPEVATPIILSANGTLILGDIGTDGNITLLGTGDATLTYGHVAYIPAKTVFGIGG